MIEIRFRIVYAAPFRVSSGYGAPGIDATLDPDDPLPGSSLKGVMRATAVELGLAHALIGSVFGTPRQESPWAWSSAVPLDEGGWSTPHTAARVALDEHHAATRDMLAMAEQLVAGAAEFSVTQHGPCTLPAGNPTVGAVPGGEPQALDTQPSDIEPLDAHQALLAVAGQATRSLGAARRRGLGWVQIHCLTYNPSRAQLGMLLGAT
jgi:hypothetical protein